MKIPEFKKIKVSNIIAIGGMIASGKTTLVNDLADELKANKLFELYENDPLQDLLLKGLYEKKLIDASVFQLYFFLKRFEYYKNAANDSKITIADRTIFEDRIFAYENMANDNIIFGYYDQMWTLKINELIYSYGVPKLYIIIDIDWETFKERIFKRNRKVEIDNFNENVDYFKHLNSYYVDYLTKTCINYGIDYLVVDAKMDNSDKIKLILNKLKDIN